VQRVDDAAGGVELTPAELRTPVEVATQFDQPRLEF